MPASCHAAGLMWGIHLRPVCPAEALRICSTCWSDLVGLIVVAERSELRETLRDEPTHAPEEEETIGGELNQSSPSLSLSAIRPRFVLPGSFRAIASCFDESYDR